MIYLVYGNFNLLISSHTFAYGIFSNVFVVVVVVVRVLGSVGEPINPEAWLWYYNMIGKKKCSIVDTFWQTETGGHVITPLPGATLMKPGSAVSGIEIESFHFFLNVFFTNLTISTQTFPFFGVKPLLLDENGAEVVGEGEGYLVFGQPWPGIMRTIFNNHQRYEETYFSKFPGYYCTGDGELVNNHNFELSNGF